jgi:hypothetical protein
VEPVCIGRHDFTHRGQAKFEFEHEAKVVSSLRICESPSILIGIIVLKSCRQRSPEAWRAGSLSE